MIKINEFTKKAIKKAFEDKIEIEKHYIKDLQSRIEYGMQIRHNENTLYFGGYTYSKEYFKLETIIRNIASEIEKFEELAKKEYSLEHYSYLEKSSKIKRENFETDKVDLNMFKFCSMFDKEVNSAIRKEPILQNNFKKLYIKTVERTSARDLFNKLVLQR